MLHTAPIFQNGMILQRNKPVTVWGTSTPNSSITVTIQEQFVSTTTDTEGNWYLTLPNLLASESEQLIIQSENDKLVYEDVAIGEVWVAGGQSNMEFHMRYEKYKTDALKDCPNKNIRFFDVPEVCYDGHITQFDYSRENIWRYATEKDLEYFSAVGYYFEKDLHDTLDVPVGIIGCNWGGTTAAAWMNPNTVKECGRPWISDYEERISNMDMDAYWEEQLHNPINDRGNLFADPFGEFVLPRTPSLEELQQFFNNLPDGFSDFFDKLQPQERPGCLYEYMLKTIAPYTIQGFLWYQGESDDVPGKNVLYQDMLTGLISDWRTLWNDMDLPFLLVQLPGYDKWLFEQNENHYPIIRKCQERVADTVKGAYLCSISDLGEEKDIHPKNKRDVGKRLALIARRYVYGEPISCDAPRAVTATKNENKVIITFANAEDGLYITGDSINALKLSISEKDLDYTFKIVGNELILTLSDSVSEDIHIAFAQTPWFVVNLYNQTGLPAIPFEFIC